MFRKRAAPQVASLTYLKRRRAEKVYSTAHKHPNILELLRSHSDVADGSRALFTVYWNCNYLTHYHGVMFEKMKV